MIKGVAIRFPKQNELNPRAATGLDRIDFDCRGGYRHHDDCLAFHLGGSEGYALGVVSGRCSDDATLECGRAKLRHFVVSATQLKREHRLVVFSF